MSPRPRAPRRQPLSRWRPLQLTVCFTLLSVAAATATGQQAEPNAATRALHALFDEAWEKDMGDDPLKATYLGDRRYERGWPDLSPAAIQQRYTSNLERSTRLAGIDRAALSTRDQLSYDLFAFEFRNRVLAYDYKPYLYELRPREGVQTASEQAELLPFANVADYDNWIAKLKALDRYVDQWRALLEMAVREKRTQPRVDHGASRAATREPHRPERRRESVLRTVQAHAGFHSGSRAHSLAGRGQECDRHRGDSRIHSASTSSFARSTCPPSRKSDGIWDTPDGDAFYRERAQFHTTTKLTPDEIHAIGLKEVARIRGEMDRSHPQVGLQGQFRRSSSNFLRTDPQFYYKTPDELFRAYAVMAKQIDPELVKLFGACRARRMECGRSR